MMSELQKCPVCDGRGFVKANFYDIAGQTCSFGDYAKKQQSSTFCMYCNGKGVANVGYIPEGEGMSNAVGLGGIEQMIIEALNKYYFPNGMPLIPEDKKKELFDHIDQKFRELEEKLKEGKV